MLLLPNIDEKENSVSGQNLPCVKEQVYIKLTECVSDCGLRVNANKYAFFQSKHPFMWRKGRL